MTRVTRREAIFYLLSMVVSSLAAVPRLTRAKTIHTAARGAGVPETLFTSPESRASAAAIGRAYLKQYPEENDVNKLGRSLGFTACHGYDDSRLEAALHRYDKIITDDFTTGNVVNLEGWQLSKSEARAYALFALQDSTDRSR